MTATRAAPRSAGSSARRSPACSCARSSTSARTGARRRSRRPSSRRSTCSRSASASARWSRRSAASTTSSSSAPARSPPRCCSRRSFPAMFGDVRQVQVPAHLRRDPRRAGRHRGARHRRGAVDRRARRASTAASPLLVGDLLRPRPGVGDAARPVHRLPRRLRLGVLRRCSSRRSLKSIDNFNYVTSAVITPLFLVAGTFFPIDELPEWAQVARAAQPALPLRRARAPRRRSASRAGSTSGTSACCVAFGLVMWRLAIWRMTRKLID